MKLEIRLSLRLTREKADDKPPAPDVVESQGSLIETSPQPRYVGFEVIE